MFGFFSDPSLTLPVSRVSVTVVSDGISNNILLPTVVYFGNSDVTKKAVGVPQVLISVVDGPSGLAASNVRLATTEDGLSSATPGAALGVGVVLGGVQNHVTVWVSVDVPPGASGSFSDLSLSVDFSEVAV